jgi:hypothetical protein
VPGPASPRRNALAAGGIAAVVSSLPSTLVALATGRDPLEATIAAGSVLAPKETRRSRLVAAAVPVHLTLSLAWAFLLERTLPRGRELRAGALAGLAIGTVDLTLAGRLFPRVRALPLLPQLADHVAYGATVGFVLARRRR